MSAGCDALVSKHRARRHSDTVTMVIGSPHQGRVKGRPRVDLAPPGGAARHSADYAVSNGHGHDKAQRYSVPAIVLSPPIEAAEDLPVFSPPSTNGKRKSLPGTNNKDDKKHSSNQVRSYSASWILFCSVI